MPIGVPKVPYRLPGEETAQWVDLYNRLYRDRIFLAGGTRGKRLALPHCRVMIHQPAGGSQGQTSLVLSEAEEMLRIRDEVVSIYSNRTGQTLARISKDINRDQFMSAHESSISKQELEKNNLEINSSNDNALWTRCDYCGVILYIKHLKKQHYVCIECGSNLRINSTDRIENLIDSGSWRPLYETISPCDPLKFNDKKTYPDRLQESQKRTKK